MTAGTSRADGGERKATRNLALAGIGARIINASLGLGTQILLARWLVPEAFGLFATGMTVLLMLAGIATLGLGALPQRLWPRYRAAGDTERMRGLLWFAERAPLVIAGGLAALLALAVGLAAPWLEREVMLLALLLLAALPAMAAADVAEGIALAEDWGAIGYGTTYVLRPLAVPLLFLGLHGSGVAGGAVAAMAATAAAAWMAWGTLILWQRRALRRLLTPGARRVETRAWIATALPLVAMDSAFLVLTAIDTVLLTLLAGPAETALYAVAARLVALVAFVHFGLSWAVAHRFSALHEGADASALRHHALTMARWTFWPSVAIAVGVTAIAPWLLMVFGGTYTAAVPIVAVLLIAGLVRAFVGPAEQLLAMAEGGGHAARAYAFAIPINLAASLALIPLAGAFGAALATAAGMLAATLLIAREVRRRHGFWPHPLPSRDAQQPEPAHA